MRLQTLTPGSDARTDFNSFRTDLSFLCPDVIGDAHNPGVRDGIDDSSHPLWLSSSTVFAKAFANSAKTGFELSPETPDQKRRRAEYDLSTTAPSFTHLDSTVSDADLDKRLGDLENDVNARANTYQARLVTSILSGAFGGGDGLAKSYGDLASAMKGDAAELAGWRNLTHDQKVDLYNRISHEANMEVKYNVNIVKGDKSWSDAELNDLDAGLAKIPRSLLLDDAKLGEIGRYTALKDKAGNTIYAQSHEDTGAIDFTDIGVTSTYRTSLPAITETILHEIGHHFDNESPHWKEFMAISGWRDVGDDAALSTYKNGDTAKGSDLGITDDPNSVFVVTRQYGRTFVHREDAQFGKGHLKDYASQNPYDDFAETFMQYMSAPDELKKSAPDKYALIKKILAEQGADYNPNYVID
jgi:hypothetical protein